MATETKQETKVQFYVKGEIKKFYCNTKDICYFKEHYINQRCWAGYPVRASCRYLAKDKQDIERLANE